MLSSLLYMRRERERERERHNADIFLVTEVSDMKITRQIDKIAYFSIMIMEKYAILSICLVIFMSLTWKSTLSCLIAWLSSCHLLQLLEICWNIIFSMNLSVKLIFFLSQTKFRLMKFIESEMSDSNIKLT